jgi:hypothetical protein
VPVTVSRVCTPRRFMRPGVVAMLACCLMGVGACNIVAPAYLAIAGPGDIDREFELDDEMTTVVFIDDPTNKIATRRLRASIGSKAQEVIMRKNLVNNGNVIETRSAIAATTRDRDGKPLSIAEIGQAVGADQVIYVVVTEFNTTGAGAEASPYAGLRVKVIDSRTADRIWPADVAGFAMRVDMPATTKVAPTSRTEALRLQQALAERTGLAIAQLFYTVELPQSVRR